MSDGSSSYAGSGEDEALSAESSTHTNRKPESTAVLLDKVAEHLTATLHETLSSLTLDRCIAVQSQTSGALHASQVKLKEVNARAAEELAVVKADFVKGIALTAQVKRDLTALQARIRVCQERAKAKMPVEYHTARDELAQDPLEDD